MKSFGVDGPKGFDCFKFSINTSPWVATLSAPPDVTVRPQPFLSDPYGCLRFAAVMAPSGEGNHYTVPTPLGDAKVQTRDKSLTAHVIFDREDVRQSKYVQVKSESGLPLSKKIAVGLWLEYTLGPSGKEDLVFKQHARADASVEGGRILISGGIGTCLFIRPRFLYNICRTGIINAEDGDWKRVFDSMSETSFTLETTEHIASMFPRSKGMHGVVGGGPCYQSRTSVRVRAHDVHGRADPDVSVMIPASGELVVEQYLAYSGEPETGVQYGKPIVDLANAVAVMNPDIFQVDGI